MLHVLGSLTWLGLDVGLLALSLTGLTSDDPATVRAVYLAMNVLGTTVLIPAAILSLVTGVLLGLGTKWGLVRYHWVLVKLVLTVITAALTIFALRSGLSQAADEVRLSAVAPADAAGGLLFAPIVSLTCYLFMTVLSIYKPWGRTPWARRRAA
ncbi:membrane protein [Actinomadura sp. NBRC 104412]|nr:membrane protein [Actinomadura sp. NBRC 104412]